MKKVKILSIGLFLAMAITSFVIKYDALTKEGPRQELVLSIENERIDLNLFRETFISGIKLKGYATGPKLLQKSGSLDEVISMILDGKPVELDFEDKRAYRLELKSSMLLDDVREEVVQEIIKTLNLEAKHTTIDKTVNYLTVDDYSLAQSGLKDLPTGAASYSDIKKGKKRYLGYSLDKLAEELNEDFEGEIFLAEFSDSVYLGIEVSLKKRSETLLSELERQGIKSERKMIKQEVLFISKK